MIFRNFSEFTDLVSNQIFEFQFDYSCFHTDISFTLRVCDSVALLLCVPAIVPRSRTQRLGTRTTADANSTTFRTCTLDDSTAIKRRILIFVHVRGPAHLMSPRHEHISKRERQSWQVVSFCQRSCALSDREIQRKLHDNQVLAASVSFSASICGCSTRSSPSYLHPHNLYFPP